MKFPKLPGKNNKETAIPYHFEANKGRWLAKFNFELEEGTLISFFEKTKKRTNKFQRLRGKEQITEEWEQIKQTIWRVPEHLRNATQFKLERKIGLNNVFLQVKSDLPNFQVVSKRIEDFTISKLETGKFEAEVTFAGVCRGEE